MSDTRNPIRILAGTTITELSASVNMCMVTLIATIEVTFDENSEVFAGLVIKKFSSLNQMTMLFSFYYN